MNNAELTELKIRKGQNADEAMSLFMEEYLQAKKQTLIDEFEKCPFWNRRKMSDIHRRYRVIKSIEDDIERIIKVSNALLTKQSSVSSRV